MKSILFTIEDNCIGCNKCIYHCPVIDANISFIPPDGSNKIRVNDEKCIMCGRCLDVCDHFARDFRDDIQVFFEDLQRGLPISVIAAPAIKTNFPQYQKLFGFLQEAGVKNFYDVSFGADITTWAYLRELEQNRISSAIAQPCPPVVNYIQKHCHDILDNLVTIQSPMISTAIYLKEYLQIEDKLCFLSPCIAKIWEINEPESRGLISYSVTFYKLMQYLEEQELKLEAYPEVDYSLTARSLGEIYSLPGGLKENVYYYNPHAWVKQVEGTDYAYQYLQEYSRRKEEGKSLPFLVDILSCQHACNIGSGTCKRLDVTHVEEITNQLKVNRKSKQNMGDKGEILAYFDNSLRLKDFERSYRKEEVKPFIQATEAELEGIFQSMRKSTTEARSINCNACGYVSCLQMARAVYNGFNHIENCLDYSAQLSTERDVLEKKNKEIVKLLAEMQQKSEELKLANKRLKELDQMKSDFLSTVSHELRTPLTSVLGFARMIEKKMADVVLPQVQTEDKKVNRASRQVQDNLRIIVSEGERLTQLINNVLDISKMEAGRVDWNMDWLSMEETIDRTIASVASLYEMKGLELQKEIEGNLPLVYGDENRIVQILQNLFSNAQKFTEQGRVICRAFSDNTHLQVSVTDQGVGIASEDLDKVFDKFKQVGDTLTDKPSGTGLGLPICKEIIENHGGEIWASSEPGKGSTFSFSLPLKPAADAAEENTEEEMGIILESFLKGSVSKDSIKDVAPAEIEAVESADSKVIMIVDDEKQIRKLLREELEEKGYQVREAVDGIIALEMIRKEKPDLVLLDINMPHICGFDVAAVIKNNPEMYRIPIVIVSIVEDRQRGLMLGISDYFTKPVDMEELIKVINKLIG